MSFSGWADRHKDILGVFLLFIVLINLILLTDFYSYDPQYEIKADYYYGHSGSRAGNYQEGSIWNRNLKFGMPQYDKVFWDDYSVFYLLFSEISFFLLMVLLASLGVYLFLRSAKFSLWESLIGALFYGIAFRFFGYLPVWIYGWKLVLVSLPWAGYSVRQLKNGKGLMYIILLSLSMILCLLMYESEILIYILLVLCIYMLYSFVDLLEYHNGILHFLTFSAKIATALLIAFGAVIYPYRQLLSAGNFHVIKTVRELSDLRLIIVILITAGVFLLLRISRKRIVLYLSTGLLVLMIMYVVIYRLPWLDDMKNTPLQLEPYSELNEKLEADSSFYRIYPLGKLFKDNRWAYAHETIGGFDFYQVNRYNRIISNCLTAEIDKNININWNLLQLFNVKYILSSVKIPSFRVEYSYYSPSEDIILYELKKPLKYAWFAKDWKQMPVSEIINDLNDPDLELHSTVFLETIPPEFADSTLLPEPENEKIEVREISSEYICMQVQNDNPGLLVISEPYDEKGLWKARIDNVDTEIYAANHILRSIVIPPGEHFLEMKYDTTGHDPFRRLGYFARMLLLCLLVSEMLFSVIQHRRS